MSLEVSRYSETSRNIKDGSFYNKTSLLPVRAGFDHHLNSPPHNKKIYLGKPWTFSVKPIKHF